MARQPSEHSALRLRVVTPASVTFDIFLHGAGPWVVGSSLDCDVPVRGRGISRRHLELRRQGNGVAFRDLESTNGTLLNGEKATEGELQEGLVVQVGEALLKLGDTGTGRWPPESFPAHLRPLSLASVGSISTHPLQDDANRRHFSVEDVAHLVGRFLAESRTGQEWGMLCRFIARALRCQAVRCYEWAGDDLALKASEGDFPEKLLPLPVIHQLASLPVMGSMEAFAESGPAVILSMPVAVDHSRVCFLAAAPPGVDPAVQYQEILPVLYALCRLVLSWAEELSSRERKVTELTDRVREVELGLISRPEAAEPIVGRHAAFVRELVTADQAAPTEMAVLVTGPTGAGKELFAHRIHRLSRRSAGPFVPINCASIPESLLESELFGVERGAYTGADRTRAGFFEKAGGGTLFLDEIADLPPLLQPKLLRVLEEKQVAPLGSTRVRPVDVRIIAATNQDPQALIAAGRFRQDLYFRLAGVLIHIPPLKERGDDVLLLANHFLQMANREFGKTLRGFDEEGVTAFRHYAWPGNVRQLQAIVKQLVLLSDGPLVTGAQAKIVLQRQHPGSSVPGAGYWVLPWTEAYDAFEEDYFRRRLASHKGSISALARELGITRPNLYIKLKKWGIKPHED